MKNADFVGLLAVLALSASHAMAQGKATITIPLNNSSSSATGKCGERSIVVTAWGQDWVSANVGVQMTIVNDKGGASPSGRFLEVNTTGVTSTFTVMVGGAPMTMGPNEHQVFPIVQFGGQYATRITWCEA